MVTLKLNLQSLTVLSLVLGILGPAAVEAAQGKPKANGHTPVLAVGEVRGGIYYYAPRPGEQTWYRISQNFGLNYEHLLRINKVGNPRRSPPGPKVLIDTVRIVPKSPHEGIVINQAENKLYLFRQGNMVLRFPAAVGRPDWPTPLGHFGIHDKVPNPTWYVPPSIQEEMKRAGLEVKKSVPPGPGNPLGSYWIGVGDGSFGIHGTNNPGSIGHYATHGCIRLHTSNAAVLFKSVTWADTIRIIFQPVKMGVRKNEVYLQVHPSWGRSSMSQWDLVKIMVAQSGVESWIDWKAVERALKESEGVPVKVSREIRPVIKPTPKPTPVPTPVPTPEVVPTPSEEPTPEATPTAEPSPAVVPSEGPVPAVSESPEPVPGLVPSTEPPARE